MLKNSRNSGDMTQIKYEKVLKLRSAGVGVVAACKKAKLPVPTFYYQVKKLGQSPASGPRTSGKEAKTPTMSPRSNLTGFELRRLRTATARIQKLTHEVERLLGKL